MELLNFLLPTTELDWVFFSAIAFCFIITVSSAVIVRKSIDKTLYTSNPSSSFTDEANIRHYLANDKWDKILENGASFVLVLGLLGTFLGIGLAIQDASKVIISLNEFSTVATTSNAMDTVGKLGPVLSDIGTKFKISAWGIGSHIMIRLIIPFFSIEMIRKNFTAVQLKKLHSDKEQQKNNFYKETISIFKKNQSDNADILIELKKIATAPISIDSSLLTFTESVESYNKDSSDSITRLVDIVSSLKLDLENVLLNIDESVKSINIKTNESFTELNDLSKSIVTDSIKNLRETNIQATELIKNIENTLNTDNVTSIVDHLHSTNENLQLLKISISEVRSIVSLNLIPITNNINKIEAFLDANLSASKSLDDNLKTNEDILLSLKKSYTLMEKVNRNLLRSTIDRQINLDD